VSIIPKVIYDQLNHDFLIPTSLHLQLVDQSIRRLVGIAEDIPVRIRNTFVPVDFVILVTPTFYKNNFFVHIGVHIKMHIKL
jgi:hypothetical protein